MTETCILINVHRVPAGQCCRCLGEGAPQGEPPHVFVCHVGGGGVGQSTLTVCGPCLRAPPLSHVLRRDGAMAFQFEDARPLSCSCCVM